MLNRFLVILVLVLATPSAHADETSVRDRIVSELRRDGYADIRISRTLLGRTRFVANSAEYRREIVINPNTGVILRDYVRLIPKSGTGSNSGSGGSRSFGDDDDDDDDDDDGDDDNDDDDEDDEDEDNSGSGSSNSGSGSSNSGSGSDDESDD